MKKTYLLTFLMAFVGFFTANAAYNVMINVDNAANVKVSTMAGHGETIQLSDGMNAIQFDESENPLTIEPANGATIVSVTQNEADVLNPSGDGVYRIGVSSSMKLDIVTSGGSVGGKEISFGINCPTYPAPFKVYYEKGSEWIEATPNSFNMYSISENTNAKLVPDKFYQVTSLKFRNNEVGTAQTDGTYTFTVSGTFDYDYLDATVATSPNAKKFKLKIDYLPNAECFFENGRTEGAKYDPVVPTYSDYETEFLFEASQNPLEIRATEGARILQVTKNGEVTEPIGWNGSNGYIFEVENGDSFAVSTQGVATDVKVTAPEGNIDLKYYYFKKADGTEIALDGMSATFKGNLGEYIYVTPRPGTNLTYLDRGSNGGICNFNRGYFQVVKGNDATQPVEYQVCGNRSVNGVMINVDSSARIKVLQQGGRGEALTLTDGENTFALDAIKNALAFTATEGNEVTAVTVNGYPVTVSSNGYFLVEAVEGDYINVASRKNPIDATLKFNFNEGADVTWLKATMSDLPVELSNPMTVRSYSTLIFEAADGYVLESLACSTPGVLAMEIVPGTARYSVNIATASVTELTLDVTMKEMEPSEGNSIVIPNGDELFVSFWEMTGNDSEGTFVKALKNNTVNEVKTGNWVRIYCKDSQSEFVYVKVNGTEIELSENSDGLARTQWVKVEGRTVIDTKIDTPCIAYTNETFDLNKNIKAGNVFIVVDGKNVTQTKVYAGDTITLAAEPEVGYIFKNFVKYKTADTSDGGTPIEGNTYTFTETDIRDNFILFKGVFVEDENEKSYALRGSTAWLVDENDEIITSTSSAKGNVVFIQPDGSNTRETVAVAGQTVKLAIGTDDPDFAQNYVVAGFCLMRDFPNHKIPTNYVVDAEDADEDGVIWICGLVKMKEDGIGSISAAKTGYDSASGTLNAEGAIRVYDANGRLVAAGEGSVSVASLVKGIYVAVTEGKTFKFAK